MYSVSGYGRMLSDHTRVRAYTEALARAVRPGCTVLDIGTGTGFFAMLACRLGAEKVYAIEPDAVIALAKVAAQANGYVDRIEFFQDLSTRVTLPERVDVIVSDLRTVVPWFRQHIPAIVDARERFLKPGGLLIPAQDVLWAAVVEMPEFYAGHVGHQPEDTAGFDMSAARQLGTHAWAKVHASTDQLLSKPRACARLDYDRVRGTDLETQLSWIAERSGTGHGFVAWFDTSLIGDVGFSNAPAGDPLLYGNAFFPWQEPVSINAGDTIALTLRANLAEDDYIWRWSTIVSRGNREIARFSQSNFSALRALGSLRLRRASFVPQPVENVAIDRFILDLINGTCSAREIAEAVSARFPETYPTWEDALGTVNSLLDRYTG